MASLPPLPNLSSDLRTSHCFSSKAHWVIPGVLMQGERPTLDAINGLVGNAKCNTYVNLQAECVPEKGSILLDDGGVQDYKYNPRAMAPYGEEVVRAFAREGGPPPSFLYYGMRDMKIAKSLEGLVMVVAALASRIRSGEAIYLHCWGGKGRSGLVASCLLIELYDIDAETALRYVDAFIQLRNADGGAGKRLSSPETYGQILQVKDYQKRVRPEDEILTKALEYIRVRAPMCLCVGGATDLDDDRSI